MSKTKKPVKPQRLYDIAFVATHLGKSQDAVLGYRAAIDVGAKEQGRWMFSEEEIAELLEYSKTRKRGWKKGRSRVGQTVGRWSKARRLAHDLRMAKIAARQK